MGLRIIRFGNDTFHELEVISDQLIQNIWFTKEDYEIMRTRDHIIVNMAKEGRFEESPNRTLRGLETRLEEVADKQRRMNSHKVVLNEQQFQRQKNINLPQRIARAYSAVSEDSRKFALLIGKQDALAVQAEHQELRERLSTEVWAKGPEKPSQKSVDTNVRNEKTTASPRKKVMRAMSSRNLFQSSSRGGVKPSFSFSSPRRPGVRRSWSSSLLSKVSAPPNPTDEDTSSGELVIRMNPRRSSSRRGLDSGCQPPPEEKPIRRLSPGRTLSRRLNRVTSTRILSNLYEGDGAKSGSETGSPTKTPNRPSPRRSTSRRLNRVTSTRILASVYNNQSDEPSKSSTASKNMDQGETIRSPRRSPLRTWSSKRLLPSSSSRPKN